MSKLYSLITLSHIDYILSLRPGLRMLVNSLTMKALPSFLLLLLQKKKDLSIESSTRSLLQKTLN